MSNQKSFDHLDTWLKEVTKYTTVLPEIAVVANKVWMYYISICSSLRCEQPEIAVVANKVWMYYISICSSLRCEQPKIAVVANKVWRYCIGLYFGMLNISRYSPDGEYLCYFKYAHSSTQTKTDTKQDIYLKDVILPLSWVKQKLITCKKQLYSAVCQFLAV